MSRDYTRDYVEGRTNLGAKYDQAIASRPEDAFMDRREAQILNEVLPNLFDGRVPTALDFACGTGRITRVLEDHCDRLWGLDVSPDQLEVARERCSRTEFILADGSSGSAGVPQVDLVTAFRFFANADEPLRHAALKTIIDVLKPGGYLILNNHRNNSSVRNLTLRLAGKRPEGQLGYLHLRRLLRQHGIRVVGGFGIGWWLLRARWANPRMLQSRWAHFATRFSKLRMLMPLSPDSLIIARKL